MGLLVVLAVLLAIAAVIATCVYVLLPQRRPGSHGWLAIVPLLILFGWVIETIIVH